MLTNDAMRLNIQIKSWQEAQKDAFEIRREVFILEQGVPEELEIDEVDPLALHALAYLGSVCIGTARLHLNSDKTGQIGRMALLAPFRNQGFGRQILKALIETAQMQQCKYLSLHAQVSALPFYEKLGFQAEGPVYDEAGIPHRNMMMVLLT